MRVRLNLSYDGTDFLGWQIQPTGRTIQGEVETALTQLHGGIETRTYASGRTDAGVHAVMQVIHYDAPVEREDAVIVKAMNSLLPDDVHVWRARTVADDFHARFDARGRTYAYRLLRTPDLYLRRYGWAIDTRFDPAKLDEASALFLGEHDFRAYATSPEADESTVCDVRRIEWREDAFGWVMIIEADRFIRRLVRTLTGAIVALASGTAEPEPLNAALNEAEGRVPPPAPPQGLALLRVVYDDDDRLDQPPASLWNGYLAQP
ncbi:tRNA pseudouridine(38-40) synthase TruA [bacterium]|nr:tRNA pseudouridine(38-40) synthase TruA [bacterium]